MTEFFCFLAVCMLVFFVILRAYAARALISVRRRAGEIVGEEAQALRARENEASTLEGLEARILQLKDKHALGLDHVSELLQEIEKSEADLARVRDEDEEQAARARDAKSGR